MKHEFDRRALLLGLAASLACFEARAGDDALAGAQDKLASIETRGGGRLGVFVIDPGRGRSLQHRADERFPMCSTFKALAAAAVLARVDAGEEKLDRRIAYSASDLLEYAPVTRARQAEGGMPLGEICAAAIDYSDNTAANLMLQIIGGPEGFTRYARSLGDTVTRLDRNEPTLNTAVPGDARDTTSPRAMAQDLQAVLLGGALSESSRRQLESWMIADKVGDKRLRAGLPPSWGIGDKTGTGDYGTANTIAILRPPLGGPLLASVYYTQSSGSMDARNAIHKQVAEIIVEAFA